jgi:hypothetical protein
MKAIVSGLSVLVLSGLLASSAQAQCCYIYPPPAPDMCGPGYYAVNCGGQVYGPNYNVYPPFCPFQGMVPAPQPPGGGGGMAAFPTHPFARSPRDYFMIDFDADTNPYRLGYISTGAVAGVAVRREFMGGGGYVPAPPPPPIPAGPGPGERPGGGGGVGAGQRGGGGGGVGGAKPNP